VKTLKTALVAALICGYWGCAGTPAPIASKDFYKVGAKTPLFNGEDLEYWEKTYYYNGDVAVKDSVLYLEKGAYLSGLTWQGPLIRMNYEIELDAMRTEGHDFFVGLTVPYGSSYFSLILGGWGGRVMGISSVDDWDASENETADWYPFENNEWYHVRLRVVPDSIKAWLDGRNIVNLCTVDRKISIRLDIEESLPMGIATCWTSAAYKNFYLTRLK
jgi:hypothetical protein